MAASLLYAMLRQQSPSALRRQSVVALLMSAWPLLFPEGHKGGVHAQLLLARVSGTTLDIHRLELKLEEK